MTPEEMASEIHALKQDIERIDRFLEVMDERIDRAFSSMDERVRWLRSNAEIRE